MASFAELHIIDITKSIIDTETEFCKSINDMINTEYHIYDIDAEQYTIEGVDSPKEEL